MDKIDKFLNSLDRRRREIITELVADITKGNFDSLELKKLKGFDNLYRVRKSRVRIVFEIINGKGEIKIIDWRKEDTYKNL